MQVFDQLGAATTLEAGLAKRVIASKDCIGLDPLFTSVACICVGAVVADERAVSEQENVGIGIQLEVT